MSEGTVNIRPTSKAAFASIKPEASDLRAVVYQCIQATQGGAICEAIELALNLRHQTVSARIRELFQRGLIVDSLRRRPTRSGRAAVVWTAVRSEQ